MPQNVALIGDVEVSFEDAVQALKELPETLDSLGSVGARLESRAREVLDDFREFVRGGHSVPANSTVILYKHTGGRGPARGFNTGDAISRLGDIHWRVNAVRWEDLNDEPSSLKVEGGVALIAYEHSNYGGARLLVFRSHQMIPKSA